ncbi:hypothetical protein CVT17_00170 [Campylobacter concisus]|uniref:Uncharacterized protein n=1 Tax=Campylobacter concisus TaxID=199 RepID=A0AAE7NZA1_9BACT|nr:hypothetical protein [Campylobacter concisus]QPH85496.1 hypothetical protein CVT17_00170 [Campylobacter concisus]
MATKRILLKDLKVIRKNEKKEEIKQACIEVLFPQQATIKECRLVIENRYSVKLSNKEFSKWRKEYDAKDTHQASHAYHIPESKEDEKNDEELSNGTNNQE